MDAKACPRNYFKTKDNRCVNVTVKPLISDKGINYGVMVKLLKKNLRGYDFNDDWGLYEEEPDAIAKKQGLIREMKEKGVPQNMKSYMRMFGRPYRML